MIGRALSALAAMVVVAGACESMRGRQSATARDSIPAIYKAMEAAFQKGDAETIAGAYTEDAEWYVPEAPVIKGRSAITRAWKAYVGSGGNRLRVDVAEVKEAGDQAYEIGRFTISAPDGGVISAGKYIVIWAREPDGAWKTHRDIFNWDIPPRPTLAAASSR